MRFRSLTIEKYGAFAERTVALPAEPGLIVLYGANEAGKSTCLAAICDFLFGIPHNSPHGQAFGYDQMRLSAVLGLADGSTISLRRRKGRQERSLSDGGGGRVDEAVLSRCLGATGRERFATLFGIGHASLRSGGDRLLAADGDVGRLIVEAGGGLRFVVDAMEQMKAEADRHFSARRSADRLFYKALDGFEDAERVVKAGTLTRESYDQALLRHRQALEAKEALRSRHREADERVLRLKRLVRVIPVLRRLEAVSQDLAEFVDVAELPDDFPDRVRTTSAKLEAAELALHDAETRQAALAGKLRAIEVPQAVIDAEVAIRDVVEKAVTVGKARRDRPHRQQELAESDAKLNEVRTSIGLPPAADLDAIKPEPRIIKRVQDLASRGLALRTKIEIASEQQSSDIAALEHLRQCQAERASLGTTTPFGVAASDLALLPSAQAAFDAKTRQITQSRGILTNQLAALGFADLETLAGWRCPDAQVVQAEIQARTAIDAEIVKFADRIAGEVVRRDVADAEITRLTEARNIPSPAAVAASREARDGTWATIRELYVSADPHALVARPPAQRSDNALKLERFTSEADELADRRSAEAERVAALELQFGQRTAAQAAVVTLTSERAALEGHKLSMTKAWLEAWPTRADGLADLGILKCFVEERQSILTQAETIALAVQAAEQMRAALSPPLSALAAAEQRFGLVAVASQQLADRVQAASQAIRAHEDAYADFRAAEAAIRDGMLRMTSTQAALRTQEEMLATWQAEWIEVVHPLAVGGDVTPERGNELATLWSKVPGILDTERLTRTRLRRMDEDEAQLKQQLDVLAALVALPLPADPIAAAKMLAERLEDARKLSIERESLLAQVSSFTTETAARRKAKADAAAAVDTLCRQAGCDSVRLIEVAARCSDRQCIAGQQRNAMETAAVAGDGLSIAVLSAQCDGRDLDAIAAELTDVEMETTGLAQAMEDAVLHLEGVGMELRAYSASAGINTAVAAREAATAEIHQALRSYLERMLAHDLLSEAMDRVRAEQQDPLVLRASQLFAAATRNAFAAIATDTDGRGEPVVLGQRSSGEMVKVAQMSDGTRDQLFLAFRIAAIEQYCQAAEPLPFIADDLLVHFDDDRGAATLDLLAELGRTTQVLLFTHHHQIVKAVQPFVAQGQAEVLDMACD